MLTTGVKYMKKPKKKLEEDIKQNNQLEVIKLYCEYFKKWVSLKEGCKNLNEYCPHRTQCLIYFHLKTKEV